MTWAPRDGDQHGDQPPYGQPYGPAGYGQGQRTPPGGTNIMAILALVFAFVFPPAGIVLGHLAKRQLRVTGEQGGSLATAGLVLGYVFTAIGLIACCGLVLLLISAGQS